MSGGKRLSKPAASTAPAVDAAVGQRIRDLRRTRAMSLEAVAARTDLSIGFLSQIERGHGNPSLVTLIKPGLEQGMCAAPQLHVAAGAATVHGMFQSAMAGAIQP